MKALFFTLFSAFFLPTLVFANYTGTAYEQGSSRKKELYKFQNEESSEDGKTKIKNTWKDLTGQVALEQNAVLEGSKVIRDEVIQNQTKQKGLIEVKDGKVYFTKTEGEKSSTKDEKLQSTFVTTANFQKFIRDNWGDISSGKTVSFRYGVWDRQETVGFEIFKTGEEKIGEQQALVLKMKPSSFIIAALVKPLTFKFQADGSKLLEMNGRIAPKQQDGSKFKDLDAEVVYAF